MSNPFTTPFTCTDCGTEGMEIDSFPGPRCIECHAARFDTMPPVDVQGTLRGAVQL